MNTGHYHAHEPVPDQFPVDAGVPRAPLRELRPESLDFSGSPQLVNRTRRFVLPVPELAGGGEPLVVPSGCEDAGRIIKKGAGDAPDRGVVFFNGKDSAWQGARANGLESILINEATPEQAALLFEKTRALTGLGRQITADDMREVLRFARDELGLTDHYDKKIATVVAEMKLLDSSNPLYREVKKPTLHRAVLVAEPFVYDGPVRQSYPHGAVMVTDGKHVWGVEAGVFQRCFRAIDAGGNERPLGRLETELRTAN